MRIRTFIVSGIMLSVVAASIAGPVRADDKADINALYGKLTTAMKAKDMKGIMATGTPDFTMKGRDGKVLNAKQVVTMMESEFKMMQSFDEVKMAPKSVSIKGKTAIVMSDMTMKMTAPGPDGKQHKFASTGQSKDTLVKTPKGWLIKSTESLKESSLMDGKPFDPSKMGGAPPPPSKSMKKK